ncbi:MAG: hypothetical protein JNL11_18795 [Bdellovibrionaceae bacterium]|nr:hypothetical protein [Pseudobdellovibrionaceae bacterium]
MTTLNPLRNLKTTNTWKKNDALVLFGELFQRGYANGLVDEAEKHEMQIIKGTVGRREKDDLRPLNAEELSTVQGPIINVPLEAGFDMDKNSSGISPTEMIKDIKLSQWEETTLDFQAIEECRKNGVARFKKQLTHYVAELEKHIIPGRSFLIAHLMAGGVPRAKIIMPLMNRVFKGTEDRHLESEKFWTSDLGRLCQMNFIEVTAETLRHLIEATKNFREKVKQAGGQVTYLAYGYHGTEILIDGQLKWQTYQPYLQGWAKKKLEDIASEFFSQGIPTCVYNCPEILTNSSSIFQGVEVSLYPLIHSLEKSNTPSVSTIKQQCQDLLRPGKTLDDLFKITKTYYSQPVIIEMNKNFEQWPCQSNRQQMELMLKCSDELIELHANPKQLITSTLSEVVFKSCGTLMLNDAFKPDAAVRWIGHDAVAKYYQ